MIDHPATRTGPYVSPSQLPSATDTRFAESSFFISGNTSFPTPSQVRHKAGLDERAYRPLPVTFSSLNMLVKWGGVVTIAEGQCLWAIKRLLPSVPVPEVYGWCQDKGQTFIFMELIQGHTLEQEWPDMDVEDRFDICRQLHQVISDLRQLSQEPGAHFIGDISKQQLNDVIFATKQPAGPFEDVPSFHDWIASLKTGKLLTAEQKQSLWRTGMLDDSPIVFTHGDLHRSNIIVTRNQVGMPYISAIIDWHQSGWYPAPWEFYKTRFTCKHGEMWELEYVLEFVQAYRSYICWEYFTSSLT